MNETEPQRVNENEVWEDKKFKEMPKQMREYLRSLTMGEGIRMVLRYYGKKQVYPREHKAIHFEPIEKEVRISSIEVLDLIIRRRNST